MTIFFLSDIHLDKNEEDRIIHFIEFLKFCERQKAIVYILGDLFNFWVGDAQSKWYAYQDMLSIMKQKSKEKKLFFLAGNRDFLFSSYFKKHRGEVLQEKTVITLGEDRILLSHGDILCSKDILYQKIRTILRQNYIYQLSRLLPGFICLSMGKKLRKASKASTQKKDYSLLKPDIDFAKKLLAENNCNILLCGHFHSSGIFLLSSSEKLYLLPECIDKVFSYLVWEKGKFYQKEWT